MKYRFYEIKHLDNPEMGIEILQREGNASFFSSNPIKKLGKDYRYVADLSHYSIYRSKSKFSWAEKGVDTVKIYTFGEELPLKIKGWIFPNVYEVKTYSNARGDIGYSSVSFSCRKPNGDNMNVFYRLDKWTMDLLAGIITKLTSLKGTIPNNYQFDLFPGFS